MSNCHSSNVIDSFLRKGVRIKFKNGEVRIGLLLNKEMAEKFLNRPLCNAPYHLIVSSSGNYVPSACTSIAFYKSLVSTIKFLGNISVEREVRP